MAKKCPKCKSLNVRINITAGSAVGMPQKWECNECGYESFSIFPDEEDGEKEE